MTTVNMFNVFHCLRNQPLANTPVFECIGFGKRHESN